ncbi:MAG: hypothetical protein QNJ64_11600 [Crocosphaera sp.]|nr:hypothetical protein [Crocosphaera sp.]
MFYKRDHFLQLLWKLDQESNLLDELIFSSTGKHIDSLQVAILKGVLNGQRYANIAKDYNCSKGHVKD